MLSLSLLDSEWRILLDQASCGDHPTPADTASDPAPRLVFLCLAELLWFSTAGALLLEGPVHATHRACSDLSLAVPDPRQRVRPSYLAEVNWTLRSSGLGVPNKKAEKPGS